MTTTNNSNDYRTIGTIVGNNSTDTFLFCAKNFEAKVGDIVITKNKLPHSDRGETIEKYVWGRIISMDRWNPFLVPESSFELANESINSFQTTLSHTRDQLQATVKIIGVSMELEEKDIYLRPLIYPVQPGSEVLSPPAKLLQNLFAGNLKGQTPMRVGTLINRFDVQMNISADKIYSRHAAILGMSGSGKSVLSRRLIRESGSIGYPVVIFDNAGDYLGLFEHQKKLENGTKVKLFYPNLSASKMDVQDLIRSLFFKTGINLTEPQKEAFYNMLNSDECEYVEGSSILPYVRDLSELATILAQRGGNGTRPATYYAIRRGLNELARKIDSMEKENKYQRNNMSSYDFEELPNPQMDPEKIISKNQISLVYLGGYDDLMQSTIVSHVLEKLFYARSSSSLNKRILPFQAVIEEAHNFCPPPREGSKDKPSLWTIRKIAREGRKWGVGLMLISQKPSGLDETSLSQCNTFMCMRLTNPRDQEFVRRVMEQISVEDLNWLKAFGDGQGFISGQAVKFPVQIQVEHDSDLMGSYVGREDFINEVNSFKKRKSQKKKEENDNSLRSVIKKVSNG